MIRTAEKQVSKSSVVFKPCNGLVSCFPKHQHQIYRRLMIVSQIRKLKKFREVKYFSQDNTAYGG